MIVLDASAAIEWLLLTPEGQKVEKRIYSHSESLHAPHILDLEIGQVLRRLVRDAVISASRADRAIQDVADLRLTRYSHLILLPRIWQLRHNLTAYDAAYVSLAETLQAPLVTFDARLRSSSGHSAQIEVL